MHEDTLQSPLSRRYDVIVVGARCSGAATAMLLARAGLRVLAIDKGSLGADTVSTHALMRGAVVQLHRWGLLDAIRDAGTPPIRKTSFHYQRSRVDVAIRVRGGVDALYAPRRTLLDRVLVEAAREAGADVRHGTSLTALVHRHGRVRGVSLATRDGGHATIEADLVVGADGVASKVAALAGARTIVRAEHTTAVVYGYFAGLPDDAYRWYWRPGVSAGLVPTNDGEACVFVATDPARMKRELAFGADAAFEAILGEAAPEIVDHALLDRRRGLLRSFRGERGFIRQAFGPGWALVGDAGFFKDPLTSHGITDALRDAELLARGVSCGELDAYAHVRDELASPMLRVSDAIASFGWDDARVQELHAELSAEMKRGVAALADLEPLAA